MTRRMLELAVPHWTDQAACQPLDSGWWFPEPGSTIPAGVLSICASCPIRRRCLTSALTNRERYGIWAGLTANELDDPLAWLADGEPLDAVLDELLELAATRPAAGVRVDYYPAPDPAENDDTAAGFVDSPVSIERRRHAA